MIIKCFQKVFSTQIIRYYVLSIVSLYNTAFIIILIGNIRNVCQLAILMYWLTDDPHLHYGEWFTSIYWIPVINSSNFSCVSLREVAVRYGHCADTILYVLWWHGHLTTTSNHSPTSRDQVTCYQSWPLSWRSGNRLCFGIISLGWKNLPPFDKYLKRGNKLVKK